MKNENRDSAGRRFFRACRVDKNQPQIVAAFRRCGCTVVHTHEVGKGCPDILVGYQGRNYLFEIKQPCKNPRKKLTPKEAEFFQTWKGQTHIVTSVDEVLAYFELIKQDALVGGGNTN